MTTTTATIATSLRRRARETLTALAAEFLLGMGVNLLPDDGGTATRILHSVVLGLHALVGVGLLVVAVRLLLAARRDALGPTEAIWALVALGATFVCGVLTVLLQSDWFSFLMAAGFLVSAILVVRILLLDSAVGSAS